MNTELITAIGFAFLIAFVFSMFGQGGGSVYSPLLIVLGFSTLISTSTALALNLLTSLSAAYVFFCNHKIDFRVALSFAPSIAIGAFSGGVLFKYFDNILLLWMLLIFLLLLGARMIFSYWEKKVDALQPPQSLTTRQYILIAGVGLGVGFISGLLGIGGGIFVVPFMVYLLGFPAVIAAGSSTVVVAISSIAGILGHLTTHPFNLTLISLMGLAVLIGANLGARVSLKINTCLLKSGMGLIMWVLAAQILVRLLR